MKKRKYSEQRTATTTTTVNILGLDSWCYYGSEGAPPTNEHTLNAKETILVYICRGNTRSSASCEARSIQSSMVLCTY